MLFEFSAVVSLAPLGNQGMADRKVVGALHDRTSDSRTGLIFYLHLELDMALYGTDIQRWTVVKAREKTDMKESRFSAFCKKSS